MPDWMEHKLESRLLVEIPILTPVVAGRGIPVVITKNCLQILSNVQMVLMEQWTGSKLGKEYVKAVYCHPAYLTNMQSTSCEMPGWMKHKLESRLLGELSVTLDV